jgi:hypothetical protein
MVKRIHKFGPATEPVNRTGLLGNTALFIIVLLILSVPMLGAITAGPYASESIEEKPDTVLSSDHAITGEFNEFSKNYIVVESIRYSLCKNVKVFTPQNRMIPISDIDAAEEVKLFSNKGCVRKIKVLRFAQ